MNGGGNINIDKKTEQAILSTIENAQFIKKEAKAIDNESYYGLINDPIFHSDLYVEYIYDNMKIATITHFNVKEKYRGNGLGQAKIKYFMDTEKYDFIVINLSSNASFWEKFDYITCSHTVATALLHKLNSNGYDISYVNSCRYILVNTKSISKVINHTSVEPSENKNKQHISKRGLTISDDQKRDYFNKFLIAKNDFLKTRYIFIDDPQNRCNEYSITINTNADGSINYDNIKFNTLSVCQKAVDALGNTLIIDISIEDSPEIKDTLMTKLDEYIILQSQAASAK